MNPEELPLRDLHLPDMTGWWPVAPGWLFLVALMTLGLALIIRNALVKWRSNQPRRLALKRLRRITAEYDEGAGAVILGKELSDLTRRAMLAYAPRNTVAGLTGEAWLEWLDRGLDERLFSEGAGKILESLPYMNPAQVDDDTDVHGLISAVRCRLQQRLPEVRS